MILAFGDWELDTDLFELRRNGEVRKIEPQAFNLLHLLIRNRHRVVTKDEVVDEIWGGRIVTEATISTCVKAARQAIGDDGKAQRFVKTSHGRGFRFVGEIAETPAAGRPGSQSAGTRAGAPAWTSLAVLPFAVFSSDPEMELIADGLVESLTTILARVPDLTVISRSSSFTYKGQSPAAQRVREELGVSHMIEGSVRANSDRLRINVQLIDAADAGHVWAERFDRLRMDAGNLEEEVTRAIARKVEPQLAKSSYDRVRRSAQSGDSWLMYQEAVGLLAAKGWRPDTFSAAAELLQRSVAIEADFARAHAYLALILALGQRLGLLTDRDKSVEESRSAGEVALNLGPSDPTVLGYVGCALTDIGDLRQGLLLLETAVEQDPSNAQAWAALGSSKILARRTLEGIVDLQHSIRISPLDSRLAVWGSFLAFGLMLSGDLEGALSEAETACRRDIRNHLPMVMASAIAIAAGKQEQARAALDDAYRLRPDLSEAEIVCLVGERSLAAMKAHGLI